MALVVEPEEREAFGDGDQARPLRCGLAVIGDVGILDPILLDERLERAPAVAVGVLRARRVEAGRAFALGVWAGFPQAADPLVGLLITVAILWVLKGAAGQIFGRLMDAVEPALVDTVYRLARSVDGVQELSGVRIRWIGHRLEASLHATVDCEMTVSEGHEVAETIRHDLLHGIRGLDDAVVHIDPCDHDGRDHHAKTRPHQAVGGVTTART